MYEEEAMGCRMQMGSGEPKNRKLGLSTRIDEGADEANEVLHGDSLERVSFAPGVVFVKAGRRALVHAVRDRTSAWCGVQLSTQAQSQGFSCPLGTPRCAVRASGRRPTGVQDRWALLADGAIRAVLISTHL